jgi:arginine exporter protein ArgO
VNALDALRAAGLGFGLGVVTGMPLGVLNTAIIDAAAARRHLFARGLGVGGGIADAVHAALAFAGVGGAMVAEPALVRGLAIAAAVVIVGYAVLAWRRRRGLAGRAAAEPAAKPADLSLGRGTATGVMLTLPNPAALAAWVAVAAALWPDATPVAAALLAGGVGAGSALWFVLLARWVGRIRRDHPVLTVIPRIALGVLIAIALIGVVRVL